ncbi:MAG: universal stress protein [Betaproteobacteria bacterium]|nr:universal stress protein [Betaproteobacteria bacterium]
MKYLIPVDASKAALVPVEHLCAEPRRGAGDEVLLLNVQPRFHRHIAQFTCPAARDALRAERSRAALTEAIARLSTAGVAFKAMTAVGPIAAQIAAIAEAECVDEVLIGTGRHPAWLRWANPSIAQQVIARTDIPVTVFARGRESPFERYALPAGIAGAAALLIAAE